jgi:hypothetical protein
MRLSLTFDRKVVSLLSNVKERLRTQDSGLRCTHLVDVAQASNLDVDPEPSIEA